MPADARYATTRCALGATPTRSPSTTSSKPPKRVNRTGIDGDRANLHYPMQVSRPSQSASPPIAAAFRWWLVARSRQESFTITPPSAPSAQKAEGRIGLIACQRWIAQINTACCLRDDEIAYHDVTFQSIQPARRGRRRSLSPVRTLANFVPRGEHGADVTVLSVRLFDASSGLLYLRSAMARFAAGLRHAVTAFRPIAGLNSRSSKDNHMLIR